MGLEGWSSWARFGMGMEAGDVVAAGGVITQVFRALHHALEGYNIVQDAIVLQILDYGVNKS